MAVTITFQQIAYSCPSNWDIDEYEKYYLQRHGEVDSDRIYYTDRNGNKTEIDHIDHFPELKEYQVWSEGYSATGEHSGASLVGTAKARNFAHACDIVMCLHRLKWINEINNPDYTEYIGGHRWSYNPRELSDWACKLFWNETHARKSFG